MNEEITIQSIDPTTFELYDYKTSDTQLIAKSELDTVFSSSTDYIEFYIYDENQNQIYPQNTTIPLTSYKVKNGDVLLNPQSDLENLGFDIGTYSIVYEFYRKRLSSNINETYFIKEISSDRTEIRLDSNIINNTSIVSSSNEFIEYRNNAEFFVDFYLNFGSNTTIIANNIALDNENPEDPTVLIKLYEPLPENLGLKDQLWVVEQLSKSQAYQVNFPFIPIIEDDFIYVAGPNFNLDVKQEIGNSSQAFSYNTLINSNITSSVNQIQNLLKEKEININVNYEDFSNFIHFSTALTRLENFYYKVGLIENYTNDIVTLNTITGDTTNTIAYSSSISTLTSKIDSIIQNFDGYEYFMYFNSGSNFSYPKTNSTPPFSLASTGSVEVLNWIGSADESNAYYGGVALSASNFDESNLDRLYNTIPEYLKEDPNNIKYELFIDMVAQHYDNIWLYTKDITNKFNADNRLEYGISKDLVADAIKDFGVKLYTNGFNNTDLYSAFLGITPSGSLFPFPDITGSLPAPSGYEYVDTQISASNNVIPLNDVNKRLYKRIYHNIPYLLKTKGTIAGLRALITSYGIPDTILRINEFGGKDRNESQDWDLEQNVFNYAFDTGVNATNFVTTSFTANSKFGSANPKTIQLRFKSAEIPLPTNNTISPNVRFNQLLFKGNLGGSLVLEYDGLGFVSSSYSGSSIDPYDTWGTLKWIPNPSLESNISSSVYLPFFNGDWWSVQISLENSFQTSSLYAANEIDGNLGFISSSIISGYLTSYYANSNEAYLNRSSNTSIGGTTYQPFSGSYQELRYFNTPISQNAFYDFVLNPYSIEGSGVNTSPNELFFRADLGTTLNIDSRTSIHPKVTGSLSQITQSFSSDSSFTINNAEWVSNVEHIYQDQTPSGIKNRVTDKIALIANNIAENPYGFESGSSIATISSQNSLSPFRSIEQESFINSSYTPDVNYLEVAISPQSQINDDINAQLGYFNIGDYIGDPRHMSSDNRSYPALDTLRDAYFEKYIQSYDVVDFIRLIKFFDNSLFKMIKDFTPARTNLASGVVVKQHLLERNRQRPAQTSWENVTYSGSIKPQSRNYNTGSGDVGQYEANGGSSIYRFTGGTGGSFERYNGLETSPSASAYGLYNRFNLTQSYNESIEGSIANTIDNEGAFVGYRDIEIFDQSEFYDGEFSGSNITVTTQSLNPGCGPYLKFSNTTVRLNPIFFSLTDGYNSSTTTEEFFLDIRNFPDQGDAWIGYEYDPTSSNFKVKVIKLPTFDVDGNFIRDYIDDDVFIQIFFNDSSPKYYIQSTRRFRKGIEIIVSENQGDYTTYLSVDGGSKNWSIESWGNYNTLNTVNTESSDNTQQGVFLNPFVESQNQNIFYWNGGKRDELGYFNVGSPSTPTSTIVTNPNTYTSGSYTIEQTPNVPWQVRGFIEYTASSTTFSGGVLSIGDYHLGNSYPSNAVRQKTTLTGFLFNPVTSGSFIPAPKTVDLNGIVFNTNYNPLILGNANPGLPTTLLGGHPKFQYAATSSLSGDFGTLTISGSYTPPTGEALFKPFSGSLALAGNEDFNTFVSGQYTGILLFSPISASLDGGLVLDITALEEYTSFLPARPDLGNVTGVQISSVGVKPRYTFTTTPGLNITASWEFASNDDPYAGGGVWNLSEGNIPGNYNFGNISGVWTLNPSSYQSLPISPSNNLIYLRPTVKTSETSFTYNLSDYDLDISYTASMTYQNGEDSQNMTILNILNTVGQGPGNTFEGGTGNVGEFAKIDYQAHLKVTGSLGERIITSSLIQTNQDFYPGITYDFKGIPDVSIDEPPTLNTQSTRNEEGDIYFIEYEFTNFFPGDQPGLLNVDLDFIESQTRNSNIIISSSFPSNGLDYDLTGSVYITKGNKNNNSNSVGNIITNHLFTVPSNTSTGTFAFTSSFISPFEFEDSFRMGVYVNKSYSSGLLITGYSMSISPDTTINSPIVGNPAYNNYRAPSLSNVYIPSYFGNGILPFNKALDCQPTLNNYNDIRDNTFLMNISYNNVRGSIQPVNFTQILNNTADKAQIPDSNYTSTRSIRPRYNGTKTTGNQYNVWTIKDVDTYGKNPVIELKDAYFGYFKNIKDLYPLVNDKISLELTYLLDQQSNALPPSLEGYGADILEKTFPLSNPISIGFISSSQYAQELDDTYPIYKLTVKPTPILYSQTSSAGYASEIPLTGSGRISMYDDNDANSFVDYSFTAQGTSSWDDVYPTPVAGGSYTQILNPTEEIVTNPYGATFYKDPYTTGDGTIIFSPSGSNTVATNQQRISIQTSFATSFLNESGGVELAFDIQMLSGSTPVEFDLEDISLVVHRTGKEPFNAGSIVGSGINNLIRFVTSRIVTNKATGKKKIIGNKKRYKTDTIEAYNTQRGSYYALIENLPLNEFLSQKGVYTPGKGGSLFQGDINGLEFVIKANSGEFLFKSNDQIKFQLRIEIQNPNRKSRRFGQNLLFPADYTGPKFPVKISTIGEKTALLAGDNTGSTPFWVYEAGANPDRSILIMSSSNINEAYGGGFYQGAMIYTPGPSEYFDSGVEPAGTQFPTITSPIEFFPGDEIRFGNNENYTYTIKSVTLPENNIVNGKGKIKIVLDSEVPESINKDFFLIRRFTPKASSFIIDTPFPYSAESSGSEANGIVYPTFPTDYIRNSGSLIVTDLISKGVIK